MERLTLIKIKNPFNRAERDIVPMEYNGESLLEIRDAHIPAGMAVVISVNGQLIEEIPLGPPFSKGDDDFAEAKSCGKGDFVSPLARIYPRAGDHILFMPKIEGGGGGDNKSILRIVLMIIVMVVAPYVAPALGLTGMAATIMTCAVMVVGGLLVNALLPPAKAKVSTADTNDYDNSQAYSWNPQTLQAQGPVVPKWYGLNRLYGNIIAANLETQGGLSYANALIDLGLGPIARLYDFKINDQPYENFKGVELETRYGNLDQPVLNAFVQTKNEYPLSVKVVKDFPYVYTTIGNIFHAIVVELTFPQGLFYAEDNGGLSAVTVNVRLAIRCLGDTEWRVITSSVLATQVVIYGGRWSAGSWVQKENEPGAGGGAPTGANGTEYEGYGGEGVGYH